METDWRTSNDHESHREGGCGTNLTHFKKRKLIGGFWPTWKLTKKKLVRAIRFWSRVDIAEKDKCWNWEGVRFKKTSDQLDYGRYGSTVAHRVAWEMTIGPIPHGLMVLHKCDNPPCVNPNHLFLGTATENMQDCARKGRAGGEPRYGEDNPVSILTENQVRDILSMKPPYEPLNVTGKRYGVKGGTIWAVRHRKIWKHIIPPGASDGTAHPKPGSIPEHPMTR